MTLVMLRRDWPGGTFRRTVRKSRKDEGQQLTFTVGEPLDVEDWQLKALEKDLGHALQLAALDDRGVLRVASNDPEPADTAAPVVATNDTPLSEVDEQQAKSSSGDAPAPDVSEEPPATAPGPKIDPVNLGNPQGSGGHRGGRQGRR